MANLHRTLVALLAAPALMVPSAGAFAQPPEATPPAEVCLTNACADRPPEAAKPKTVREAIAAGDALAVRGLGGTPQDVVAALTERLELEYARKGDTSENAQRWLARERDEYRHFADPAFGEFKFTPQWPGAPEGMPMGGGRILKSEFLIQRSSPSGCTELIIVHEDGQGIPTAHLCTR